MNLFVKVTPGARVSQIKDYSQDLFGHWVLSVSLNAIPDKGEANKELMVCLSKILGIPKTSMTLLKGHTSRSKILDIPLDQDVLNQRIESALNKSQK